MVAVDRSFPNGSPVCDYWLTRCEGFTVRAGHRTLGVVESVDHEVTGGRAETIVLRRRRLGRRTLASGEVLAVVPARKVLLARRHQHAKPVLTSARRRVEKATPVVMAYITGAAAAVWALARWIAAQLRREVPRLVRFLRAEIHERNAHHGDEPGVGRAHRRPNEYDYGLSTRGR
jgi:hypothetical protein